MGKKLERTYEWEIWGELKRGELVYAIDLSGTKPKVVELWEYTVEQVARLTEGETKIEYYVVVDVEEGDEDAEDR